MAVPLNVYFLYELSKAGDSTKEFLLLKIIKPAWRNAIEIENDETEDILENKRNRVLIKYMSQNQWTNYELIGEFQGEPEGDNFYEDHGGFYIDFWMAKSDFCFPWIVISDAKDEQEFWNIIKNDVFLTNARPLPPAIKMRAIFITEQD